MTVRELNVQGKPTLILNREDYCGCRVSTLRIFQEKLTALLERAGVTGTMYIRVFSYRLRQYPTGLSVGHVTEDGLEIVYADKNEKLTEQVWVLRCGEVDRRFLENVLQKELQQQAQGLAPSYEARGKNIVSNPITSIVKESVPALPRERGVYFREPWLPTTPTPRRLLSPEAKQSAPVRAEKPKQPVESGDASVSLVRRPKQTRRRRSHRGHNTVGDFQLIPSHSAIMQDLGDMAKTLALLISTADSQGELESSTLTAILKKRYQLSDRQAVALHKVMVTQKFVGRLPSGNYRILDRARTFIQKYL